jgi:hypothetical protein
MYLPIYRTLTSTDLGFIHPQLSHSKLIMDPLVDVVCQHVHGHISTTNRKHVRVMAR